MAKTFVPEKSYYDASWVNPRPIDWSIFTKNLLEALNGFEHLEIRLEEEIKIDSALSAEPVNNFVTVATVKFGSSTIGAWASFGWRREYIKGGFPFSFTRGEWVVSGLGRMDEKVGWCYSQPEVTDKWPEVKARIEEFIRAENAREGRERVAAYEAAPTTE